MSGRQSVVLEAPTSLAKSLSFSTWPLVTTVANAFSICIAFGRQRSKIGQKQFSRFVRQETTAVTEFLADQIEARTGQTLLPTSTDSTSARLGQPTIALERWVFSACNHAPRVHKFSGEEAVKPIVVQAKDRLWLRRDQTGQTVLIKLCLDFYCVARPFSQQSPCVQSEAREVMSRGATQAVQGSISRHVGCGVSCGSATRSGTEMSFAPHHSEPLAASRSDDIRLLPCAGLSKCWT